MKERLTEQRRRRPWREVACALALAAWGQLKRFGRALLQGGGVISLLRVIIVIELCLLGVGVVRRYEESSVIAEKAAKYELAMLEAQTFRSEQQQRGAVDIVAVSGDDDATGEAPGTRARDISTIISDDLGDTETAIETLMDDHGTTVETVEDDASARESETLEETDVLIQRGVTAMIAGDMRQCILSLEQAAALSPNHPAMLYYYGMAYDKLLNPSKAREYYNKLFHMGGQAGKYFQRASRRLSYGMEQPSAMRGKLSFGPHKVQHSYSPEQGEKVSILLPVLLAPGEDIRADDVYIRVQIFELVNGRKVDFSREQPKYQWINEKQTWENSEEELIVSYEVPPNDTEGVETMSDVKYYGFTAVLAYKGEPLDLISTPSALILHEQQLNNSRRGGGSGLLPDDGLAPYSEEAVPYSEALDDPLEL